MKCHNGVFLNYWIYVLFSISVCPCSAQKYKIYSAPDSYGFGPFAIYEYEPQKKLTDFIYSRAEVINDKYFLVRESGDNSAQLLNTDLSTAIPKGKFSSISMSENPKYCTVTALDPDPNDEIKPLYGIYDLVQKKLSVLCKYNYIGHINKDGNVAFNKGGKDMMPQLVQGGKWGYMNAMGKEVLPPAYTWCSTLNDQNIGCAYVGGNSQDGLYGGYWTLIDISGKMVIDDKQYYLAERDPYNTAPGKYIQLNKKNEEYRNEYTKGDLIFDCKERTIREFKYHIEYLFEKKGWAEITGEDGLHGLVDMNEKIVAAPEYQHIEMLNTGAALLTKPDGSVFFLDNKIVLHPLDIKEYRTLDFDAKDKSQTTTESFTWRERTTWLIYGKTSDGKVSFIDTDMKKVLTQVDSGNGYAGGFSTYFYNQCGTFFLYYKNGKANYFSSYQAGLLKKEYDQLEKDFDRKMFDKSDRLDSAFAMKSSKWGLISTKTHEGHAFAYDEIQTINEKYTIARLKDRYYIFGEGQKEDRLGEFNKIITIKNTSHSIPHRRSAVYSYVHITAQRKNQIYLLELHCGRWVGSRIVTTLADSGKISDLEFDTYKKNGTLFLLWTNKSLPAGTTEVRELRDWTANSDQVFYAYCTNKLWGVMNEDGKIIIPPKYAKSEAIPSEPPGTGKPKSK